ncbi:MAG: homogentisate 1,2-dioxygenase, partial [Tepidisphaeraceae bacterium]
MPFYMKLGEIPRKRHIKLPRDSQNSFLKEGLAYEHVVTTAGFDRAYSIMYHLRPPTRIRKVELAGHMVPEAAPEMALRHHHIKSFDLPRSGDPVRGRVPSLFNEDVTAWRARPAQQQAVLFRNGGADEVIFVHAGKGTLETPYGRLPYREMDYIVIPRGTTYRLVADDINREDYLILESHAPVRIPRKYLNPDGQLMLGAPYYHRDFHGPSELLAIDKEEDTEILVKDGPRLTKTIVAQHPFDVVGWDGLIYPFTFNAMDFEPLTGTVHLPPPYQQTFEVKGFVICTFAPRYLDHHPEAIKVPYVHSNVEADEVLFYARGNFGSRKGISSGSISHHPSGIPHGPHPGTIVASRPMTRTDELAVMVDTIRPLS